MQYTSSNIKQDFSRAANEWITSSMCAWIWFHTQICRQTAQICQFVLPGGDPDGNDWEKMGNRIMINSRYYVQSDLF